MSDEPNEIQRRLAAWPLKERDAYLTGLQMIKKAGRDGITAYTLTTQMRKIHGKIFDKSFYSMFTTVLASQFDNVIGTDSRARLYWKTKNAVGEMNDPDHKVRKHIDTVLRSYEAMRELTRVKGTFTEKELAEHLMVRLNISPETAYAYGLHMLGQYQAMLIKTENSYAMREETPVSRSETMDLLRNLADTKKKS